MANDSNHLEFDITGVLTKEDLANKEDKANNLDFCGITPQRSLITWYVIIPANQTLPTVGGDPDQEDQVGQIMRVCPVKGDPAQWDNMEVIRESVIPAGMDFQAPIGYVRLVQQMSDWSADDGTAPRFRPMTQVRLGLTKMWCRLVYFASDMEAVDALAFVAACRTKGILHIQEAKHLITLVYPIEGYLSRRGRVAQHDARVRLEKFYRYAMNEYGLTVVE